MSALIFIPGFATGPAVWEKQIKEFSKDYEVSTDPEIMEKDREREKNEVYIIGWSMGGWEAMELYFKYPDKIKGLILVSAFAKYLKSEDYPYGTSPALLKKLEKRMKTDYKSGLRYFYDLVFKDGGRHTWIDQLPVISRGGVDRWFEKLEKEDKRKALPKIKIPVLLIHGDQDQISPPGNSGYMHEKLSDSELHIFEGVGHAPFLEVMREFNAGLREFIKRNEN